MNPLRAGWIGERTSEFLALAGAPLIAALWRCRAQAEVYKRAYAMGKPAGVNNHRFDRERGSGDQAVGAAGNNPREIAREFDQNHDLVVGVLNSLVDHTVGNGILVEPIVRDRAGRLHERTNLAISNLRRLTIPFLDSSQTSHGPAFERLSALTYYRDGELLGVHHAVAAPGLSFRGAVPYAVEAMEPDLLPFELTDPSRSILHGITVNAHRRPLTYHLLRSHPGAVGNMRGVALGDTVPVEAGRMMHLAMRRRLHQLRGISVLHSVIQRLDSIRRYEDSEELAARMAAAFVAVIKRPPSEVGAGIQERTGEGGNTGSRAIEMESGLIMDAGLHAGEDLQVLEHNRPNPNLAAYRDSLLRMVSAGTNSVFSTISRRHEGNYAAQRMERVDARPALEAMSQIWASGWSMPIHQWLVGVAVTTGKLKVPPEVDPDTLLDALYQGPGMDYVDPAREAKAAETEVGLELRSLGQWQRRLGIDRHMANLEIEQERRKAAERDGGLPRQTGTGADND